MFHYTARDSQTKKKEKTNQSNSDAIFLLQKLCVKNVVLDF